MSNGKWSKGDPNRPDVKRERRNARRQKRQRKQAEGAIR